MAAVAVLVMIALGCDEKPRPPDRLNFCRHSRASNRHASAPDAAGRAACTGAIPTPGAPAAVRIRGGLGHDSRVNRASVGKAGGDSVIPGDPDNSYLIQKIGVGHRQCMPRNGVMYLTPGQILVIRPDPRGARRLISRRPIVRMMLDVRRAGGPGDVDARDGTGHARPRRRFRRTIPIWTSTSPSRTLRWRRRRRRRVPRHKVSRHHRFGRPPAPGAGDLAESFG